MENKITQILDNVKQEKDFIDLIETNFSKFASGALDELMIAGANKYFTKNIYSPDSKGLLTARKAIAKYYSQKSQLLDPERIFITASTSESYNHLFNTIKPDCHKVLLPKPGYPLFEYLARYSKVTACFYKLKESDLWQPDMKSISSKISKSVKALVIISPNNPTGSIVDQDTWQKIKILAEEHDLPIIIDEVFGDYIHSKQNSLPDINTFNVPVFLLNGISKTLALPDQKLAWIICNDKCIPALLDDLEMANDSYLNANYFIQSMLPELLEKKKLVQKPIIKILQTNCKALSEITPGSGLHINYVFPVGGIYCVLKLNLPNTEEENFVLTLLTKKHVSVHPGYFYDFVSPKAHLVISLLQTPENFTQGLSRIGQLGIEYKCSR